MGRNTGKGHRVGITAGRTQTYNPKTEKFVKRDTTTGRFISCKDTPYKNIRKDDMAKMKNEEIKEKKVKNLPIGANKSGPKTRQKVGSTSGTKTKSCPKSGTKSGPKSGPKSGTKTKSGPKSGTKTGTKTKTGPKSGLKAKPKTEKKANPKK